MTLSLSLSVQAICSWLAVCEYIYIEYNISYTYVCMYVCICTLYICRWRKLQLIPAWLRHTLHNLYQLYLQLSVVFSGISSMTVNTLEVEWLFTGYSLMRTDDIHLPGCVCVFFVAWNDFDLDIVLFNCIICFWFSVFGFFLPVFHLILNLQINDEVSRTCVCVCVGWEDKPND